MPSALQLPLRLDRTPNYTAVAGLAVLLFAAAAPVAAIVGLILGQPADVTDLAREQPWSSLLLLVGVLLWSGLFVWPLAALLDQAGRKSCTQTDRHAVVVSTQTLFGIREVTYALGSFDGVVHVRRTSMFGVRHDVMLVDTATRRRVVIHSVDQITSAEVQQLCVTLGLPERAAADVLTIGPALPEIGSLESAAAA